MNLRLGRRVDREMRVRVSLDVLGVGLHVVVGDEDLRLRDVVHRRIVALVEVAGPVGSDATRLPLAELSDLGSESSSLNFAGA